MAALRYDSITLKNITVSNGDAIAQKVSGGFTAEYSQISTKEENCLFNWSCLLLLWLHAFFEIRGSAFNY